MTDKIALYLGIFISVLIIADVATRGSADLLFLGKKLAAFLEWVAFWR